MNIFEALAEKIRQRANFALFIASIRAFLAHPSLGTFIQMGRNGALLIGAVVALGVLTIVIPIVYLVSVQVGNTLPAGGLSAGQSSTLATLINNGGAALQLTTVSETAIKNSLKSSGGWNHLARDLQSYAETRQARKTLLPVQGPLGSSSGRARFLSYLTIGAACNKAAPSLFILRGCPISS